MSGIVSQPKRLCSTMNCDGEIKSQNRDAETCTIDILNDFSLLQIFDQLDISDLCNVADVNHRFKRVSKMSFGGRYATFYYPQHLKLFIPHSRESNRAQMRRVLCKFGDSIKSMKLKDFLPAGVFVGIRLYPIELDAISKFCAGTMDHLDFNLFLNLECGDWARPLFSSLKTLTVRCGGFKGDAGRLLSECHELKILRLIGAPYNDSELAQKYSKLEEVYIANKIALSAETTFALLQINQQIKKLTLSADNANKTIYAIASKMNGLQELVLRHISERSETYDNVTELAGLKSLKVLQFHDVAPEFITAIEAMEVVPLEIFKWFDCSSDLKFINRIAKWKTLKSLTLTGISLQFDDCLGQLGEQLPLLHALELGFKHQEKPLLSIDCLFKFVEQSAKLDALIIHTIHSELFNQKFYDMLLEVIQKRRSSSTAKTFQVTIYGRGLTSLQMHSNLLQVKLIESEYCLCSYCEPVDDDDYGAYGFDDDDDDYGAYGFDDDDDDYDAFDVDWDNI